jgi:dipeptidyl aminopeptidase/acylaminoacyl peptidase
MAQLSAADGVLVYAEDPGSGTLRFVRRGADGQDEALAFPPGDYGAFELSPDGSRLAVIKRPPSGQPELWIFDLERGTQERLHDAVYGLGNWSADGLALCVTAGGAGWLTDSASPASERRWWGRHARCRYVRTAYIGPSWNRRTGAGCCA